MALNHWDLAIETHNTNFPETWHDCTDISACDPRRYPSTDILITSPECTNHSLAKGQKRKGKAQRDMFVPASEDPAAERSRATMWDVPRFAEFHGYELIIVENVVDARHWVMWDAWLHAMDSLGYDHECVYLNSMFCWPTPQSRDRMYVVFWKKGNRAPDLEIRPPAHCLKCARDVESVQSWKPGRDWGRYGRQYLYLCPHCAEEVQPYYYAALNAIDFSIPAERVGDRPRPLKEKTLARIRYGLEKYGRQPLCITTRYTTGIGHRVRSLGGEPLPTQPGDYSHALFNPFLLTAGSRETSPVSVADTIPTLTGSERFGVAWPLLTSVNDWDNIIRPVTEEMGTQTTQNKFGVTIPPAFLATLRGTAADQLPYCARGLDDVLGAVTAGGIHHALVINGAAMLNMRDSYFVRSIAEALPTQVAAGTQDFLIQRQPHLVSYYGQNQASGMGEPIPTLTSLDRHALVQPDEEIDVEDCYFRMLQPHEIGAGMAFPSSYKVLGNKRAKVKQFGNAVTPPAMELLIERAVASLS
jgi:DNA (cytosine-5)-methyltransferase 1